MRHDHYFTDKKHYCPVLELREWYRYMRKEWNMSVIDWNKAYWFFSDYARTEYDAAVRMIDCTPEPSIY